jgi:pyridinium-3,5-bisthiocarboxylic acid mononucleotide nickel chelatase
MLAYFDCFSGISGDMTVAALIDLGLDPTYLENQLSLLEIPGCALVVRRSSRHGLAGVRFEVRVSSDQPHRSYRDIRTLIEGSAIDDAPKFRALEVFEIIATAEARVHGVDKDAVHFHEVGAVDSIVDVVAVAVGVHALGLERIVCSPLPMSRGFVSTAHGTIPTPAPATMEILRGVPVLGVECPIELVTPTGAAIVRALASDFGPYPSFVPMKTGYGLGKSDPKEFPNALRIVVGEATQADLGRDRIGVAECQVDDLDPRVLGDLMDVLYAEGALEVTFSAVQMKKNRPGTQISVFTPSDRVVAISRILLDNTTTLGVRTGYTERIVLERRTELMETSLGTIRVKLVTKPDGRIEKRCEFDEVREIARRTGRPTREILQTLDRELDR